MLTIKNKTKKITISKNAKLCKNIFSKTFGLMFSQKPKTMVFTFKEEKIVPLHMFFVFYPIDVLLLDKNKIVIEKKRKLQTL